ncbi:MAG: tRNA 2-thiouridine(34) synthase MnmA [Candidatus Pacearchaeota archaeon]|nr:tRNA 2-thiouridine(34) synthase MnmA [Nanoarchaeota archaeon]MDZ4226574.1 tRNA 2-thiouridine(34) synthase MnmA [Candidatus Pacearchaeota archaeon]
MKKQKVLVAMSGGVDSSVAALLLKKRGFEVIGAFMKNWSDTKNDIGECTWIADRKVAMAIASKIGIPLVTLDFEDEYKKDVVNPMFALYKKGITPNPDIDCNNKVKFPLLWKAAEKLGADFIATGHYIRKNSKKLLRAKDESKDQSYFLYRINKDDISHSLFPIGDLTKVQVREIAKENGFENFDRKSTVGICFIGKVNLKKFLQARIPAKTGKIFDPDGKVIGFHDGIYYYTIGQRLGPRFGIEIERGKGQQLKRWYVASKNLKKNEIIAAPENHDLLYRKEITLKQPHWTNDKPKGNVNVKARIRQVGELLPSKLYYDKSKKQYKITLNKPITGISEGQAAVLYHGVQVIGGGVIEFD